MTQKIITPHAAVIIWNYNDRLGADSQKDSRGTLNEIEQTVISTVSCISISTAKSKSNPSGTFEITLAPTRNWTSTITAGSWCAILMSTTPIEEKDIMKANPSQLKMIGRIETVRVSTQKADDGSRQTQYLVSGVDWGYIFNNSLYLNSSVYPGPQDAKTFFNNPLVLAIRNLMFDNSIAGTLFSVKNTFKKLIDIFGAEVSGDVSGDAKSINVVDKTVYDFNMPTSMVKFLNIKKLNTDDTTNQTNNKNTALNSPNDVRITKNISIISGTLADYNKYIDYNEAGNVLNPIPLQGQNTLWQILTIFNNNALREMYCDLEWQNIDGTEDSLFLNLYNRIKPFSYKKVNDTNNISSQIRSYMQNVRTFEVDSNKVLSINAGTNWRDKFNYIELRPGSEIPEFDSSGGVGSVRAAILPFLQTWDSDAFNREGFRPLIMETKVYPFRPGTNTDIAWEDLKQWMILLREWYFDTHRMLNGTINLVGQGEHIPVGSNILFDAELINPTKNFSSKTITNKNKNYILAHVESVNHSFTVSDSGARNFTTTIQFTRGILVDANRQLIGEGVLDRFADQLASEDDVNTKNVVSTKSDKVIKQDVKSRK